MLKAENAFLLDICLGYPFGKVYFPADLPDVDHMNVPETYLIKGEQLGVIRELVKKNDLTVKKAIEGLEERAAFFLSISNPSVTDKPSLLKGVGANDYCSLAKYWWPNPDSPDGLPYIMRDGEVNPDCYSDKSDLNRIDLLSEATFLLAIAAYVTDKKEYAKKASRLIHTWLLDPKTSQTPHFRYAQIVQGKEEEYRFQALVESRRLIYVCEAIQILKQLSILTTEEYEGCKLWFKQLLKWMNESEQGQKAIAAKNNIGFWVDLQRLIYARFCQEEEIVEEVLRVSIPNRIEEQIEENGKLTHELSRAKPYDYIAFTLLAMAGLSAASRDGKIMLADYSNEEGKNFQNAFNWFNETIKNNELQEKSFALAKFVQLQQEVFHLREEKQRLESALLRLEKNNEHQNKDIQGIEFNQNDYISQLQEKLNKAKLETERLNKELHQNSESLMGLSIYYRGMEVLNKEQKRQIQMMNEEAMHQSVKISNQKSTISNLEAKIKQQNDLDEQIKKQVAYIKELEEKNKKAEKNYKEKIKKLDHERKQIRREYTKLIKSRSWRITSPIRKVTDIIKSIVRGKPIENKKIQSELTTAKPKEKINTVPKKEKTQEDPLKLLHSVQPKNEEGLKKEYNQKGLDKVKDSFVLYRIIGNDLYPRHKKGQSRENLRFVLENEKELENCDKRWIVNRIIDEEEEKAIINLLESHGKKYVRIPFNAEEYQQIGIDTDCLPEPGFLASKEYEALGPEQRSRVIGATYRLKNNYVMNNNGARNAALQDGKQHAKWVLPWDGNCFLTPSAWKKICEDVTSSPHLKYFAVPMTRVQDNSLLLSENFTPDPVEEPQLIFRSDSTEHFNEDFCYGRRPKVELFWRLGIPGKWDRWKDDPWDIQRRDLSPEASQFGVAGWVARMFSGMGNLEQDTAQSFKNRGLARLDAIITTLRYVDTLVAKETAHPSVLTSFRLDQLTGEIEQYKKGENPSLQKVVGTLIEKADEALLREPYSVIDKTTLPPSGNINDYWHPAPYWWPDPEKPDGLPYIRKDGIRVPGTRMYEPESDKYDRTRLQLVFDDSITLALAWKFTGEKKYAEHGVNILERFFVNPSTRMTPHLNYAQVRMGRNKNIGFSTGIIEMKDMYYYLDAVRIFTSSGVLKEEVLQEFKEWLNAYLKWLIESPQGKKERKSVNNHGTYYDLQVAAISSYLNEQSILFETIARGQSRIAQQFAVDGSQPEELTRTTTAHYCCYNFQGWLNLSKIAIQWGNNLWAYEAPNGSSLLKGAEWLLSYMDKKWPYEQIDEFDEKRFYPIYFSVPNVNIAISSEIIIPGSPYEVKSIFFPHDGVQPYWNLGLFTSQLNSMEYSNPKEITERETSLV